MNGTNLRDDYTYSGINVLLLWIDAADKGGGTFHRWLAFKQALDGGGNVRKGEKSTLVTLFKPFEKKDTDEQGNALVSQRNVMTSFHLFNVEQRENLPEKLLTPVSMVGEAEEIPEQYDIERIKRAEQVVTCSGVLVVLEEQRESGNYNASRIWDEMVAKGFTGSETIVRDAVARWRKGWIPPVTATVRLPSASRVSRWLMPW